MIVGEIAIRLLGQYDFDENFQVGKITFRPYKLPVNSAEKYIGQLLQEKEKAIIQYDSLLGWAPRPLSRSADGLYIYNAQGVRVGDQNILFSDTVSQDTFRIVLIGDSFTHGSEVVYEKSWGYLLEKKLNKNGIPAQVINLGVGAFGMDQAYWRWESIGKQFNSDLVIFGLQFENVRRNVNLFRSIYTPTAHIPLSKPRFILDENKLKIINQPPVPPDQVVDVLSDFENWELATHEYFYRPQDFRSSVVFKSKFIAFLREHISPNKSMVLRHPYGTKAGNYSADDELGTLTMKILDLMNESVENEGAQFLMVHLPHIWGLGHFRKYGYFPYDQLSQAIEGKYNLIETKLDFEKRFNQHENEDFYLWFHYSDLGNEIIAESVFKYIVDL